VSWPQDPIEPVQPLLGCCQPWLQANGLGEMASGFQQLLPISGEEQDQHLAFPVGSDRRNVFLLYGAFG
jgi:hypothetical protein